MQQRISFVLEKIDLFDTGQVVSEVIETELRFGACRTLLDLKRAVQDIASLCTQESTVSYPQA